MHTPAQSPDEGARLDELRKVGLLDTVAEERFDRVTRLAQRLFGVPIALVSLVDEDRQWFKSRQGLDACETSRAVSFCGHAILRDGVMEVRDASADPRFFDNPLVTGAPRIRFYAGCPIKGPSGANLGTLCIIDHVPRSLTGEDRAALCDLAAMVEAEIGALNLALVDELTGLSNRRGFERFGRALLELCCANSLPATLLYIDLDGFKAINDIHGHDHGDLAIVEFADLLRNTFRQCDLIARLGGDEFALLLPQASTRAPHHRLVEALARRNAARGRRYTLRASIGSASFDPSAAESLAELTRRADGSMLVEKRRSAQLRV